MNRTATVSLVSYSPVAGDAPDRLARTLEKMGMHITQAVARLSGQGASRPAAGSGRNLPDCPPLILNTHL